MNIAENHSQNYSSNSTLYYDVELGAFPSSTHTLFRVFAPNAKQLIVRYGKTLELEHSIPATCIEEGLWEAVLPEDLSGQFYAFKIEPLEDFQFNPEELQHILDPYALASVSAKGPGIIINRQKLHHPFPLHTPPQWQNLVILECHIRDILGLAKKREVVTTYAEFENWIQTPENYLKNLGINTIEFQPLQEMDSPSNTSYHWGYMPVNYFSPTRMYSQNPENGSVISDTQHLIKTIHQEGFSVVLDVVYNHVGDPNALRMLGGNYFFRGNPDGSLCNISGCGNDLRTEAPMARKLILDSLKYWVKTFDVDGFRFDLAELIDFETLELIERKLKSIKPSIVLIAEPWSFRGHIGLALKKTGWASWNDDFREFIKRYVCGRGNAEGLKYFLSGCLSYLTRFPAQTVNYTASHDDRTWIDSITENANFNGHFPTENDIARTRLMFSILMMCFGMPMIAEGQDFLRTKNGALNTYKDGDRNRLSPQRLKRYQELHQYVANWIHFRLSNEGGLTRPFHVPGEQFFRFIESPQSNSALATLFNADFQSGNQQLLFLINPDQHPATVSLENIELESFILVANQKDFYWNFQNKTSQSASKLDQQHIMPALSCELWIRK